MANLPNKNIKFEDKIEDQEVGNAKKFPIQISYRIRVYKKDE